MECRMTVKTPPGQAGGAAKKFQLVGRFKPKNLEVAEDQSSFTFTIEEPLKKVVKIQRRCQQFQTMANAVLRQKATGLVVSKEQRPKLQEYLAQTEILVEVTRPASAEELADFGETRWDKVKKWFKGKR